jgi:primosomal protein N' (replication factor Y)
MQPRFYLPLIEIPRVPDAILRLALPSPLRRLFDYRAPAGVLRAQCTPACACGYRSADGR